MQAPPGPPKPPPKKPAPAAPTAVPVASPVSVTPNASVPSMPPKPVAPKPLGAAPMLESPASLDSNMTKSAPVPPGAPKPPPKRASATLSPVVPSENAEVFPVTTNPELPPKPNAPKPVASPAAGRAPPPRVSASSVDRPSGPPPSRSSRTVPSGEEEIQPSVHSIESASEFSISPPPKPATLPPMAPSVPIASTNTSGEDVAERTSRSTPSPPVPRPAPPARPGTASLPAKPSAASPIAMPVAPAVPPAARPVPLPSKKKDPADAVPSPVDMKESPSSLSSDANESTVGGDNVADVQSASSDNLISEGAVVAPSSSLGPAPPRKVSISNSVSAPAPPSRPATVPPVPLRPAITSDAPSAPTPPVRPKVPSVPSAAPSAVKVESEPLKPSSGTTGASTPVSSAPVAHVAPVSAPVPPAPKPANPAPTSVSPVVPAPVPSPAPAAPLSYAERRRRELEEKKQKEDEEKAKEKEKATPSFTGFKGFVSSAAKASPPSTPSGFLARSRTASVSSVGSSPKDEKEKPIPAYLLKKQNALGGSNLSKDVNLSPLKEKEKEIEKDVPAVESIVSPPEKSESEISNVEPVPQVPVEVTDSVVSSSIPANTTVTISSEVEEKVIPEVVVVDTSSISSIDVPSIIAPSSPVAPVVVAPSSPVAPVVVVPSSPVAPVVVAPSSPIVPVVVAPISPKSSSPKTPVVVAPPLPEALIVVEPPSPIAPTSPISSVGVTASMPVIDVTPSMPVVIVTPTSPVESSSSLAPDIPSLPPVAPVTATISPEAPVTATISPEAPVTATISQEESLEQIVEDKHMVEKHDLIPTPVEPVSLDVDSTTVIAPETEVTPKGSVSVESPIASPRTPSQGDSEFSPSMSFVSPVTPNSPPFTSNLKLASNSASQEVSKENDGGNSFESKPSGNLDSDFVATMNEEEPATTTTEVTNTKTSTPIESALPEVNTSSVDSVSNISIEEGSEKPILSNLPLKEGIAAGSLTFQISPRPTVSVNPEGNIPIVKKEESTAVSELKSRSDRLLELQRFVELEREAAAKLRARVQERARALGDLETDISHKESQLAIEVAQTNLSVAVKAASEVLPHSCGSLRAARALLGPDAVGLVARLVNNSPSKNLDHSFSSISILNLLDSSPSLVSPSSSSPSSSSSSSSINSNNNKWEKQFPDLSNTLLVHELTHACASAAAELSILTAAVRRNVSPTALSTNNAVAQKTIARISKSPEIVAQLEQLEQLRSERLVGRVTNAAALSAARAKHEGVLALQEQLSHRWNESSIQFNENSRRHEALLESKTAELAQSELEVNRLREISVNASALAREKANTLLRNHAASAAAAAREKCRPRLQALRAHVLERLEHGVAEISRSLREWLNSLTTEAVSEVLQLLLSTAVQAAKTRQRAIYLRARVNTLGAQISSARSSFVSAVSRGASTHEALLIAKQASTETLRSIRSGTYSASASTSFVPVVNVSLISAEDMEEVDNHVSDIETVQKALESLFASKDVILNSSSSNLPDSFRLFSTSALRNNSSSNITLGSPISHGNGIQVSATLAAAFRRVSSPRASSTSSTTMSTHGNSSRLITLSSPPRPLQNNNKKADSISATIATCLAQLAPPPAPLQARVLALLNVLFPSLESLPSLSSNGSARKDESGAEIVTSFPFSRHQLDLFRAASAALTFAMALENSACTLYSQMELRPVSEEELRSAEIQSPAAKEAKASRVRRLSRAILEEAAHQKVPVPSELHDILSNDNNNSNLKGKNNNGRTRSHSIDSSSSVKISIVEGGSHTSARSRRHSIGSSSSIHALTVGEIRSATEANSTFLKSLRADIPNTSSSFQGRRRSISQLLSPSNVNSSNNNNKNGIIAPFVSLSLSRPDIPSPAIMDGKDEEKDLRTSPYSSASVNLPVSSRFASPTASSVAKSFTKLPFSSPTASISLASPDRSTNSESWSHSRKRSLSGLPSDPIAPLGRSSHSNISPNKTDLNLHDRVSTQLARDLKKALAAASVVVRNSSIASTSSPVHRSEAVSTESNTLTISPSGRIRIVSPTASTAGASTRRGLLEPTVAHRARTTEYAKLQAKMALDRVISAASGESSSAFRTISNTARARDAIRQAEARTLLFGSASKNSVQSGVSRSHSVGKFSSSHSPVVSTVARSSSVGHSARSAAAITLPPSSRTIISNNASNSLNRNHFTPTTHTTKSKFELSASAFTSPEPARIASLRRARLAASQRGNKDVKDIPSSALSALEMNHSRNISGSRMSTSSKSEPEAPISLAGHSAMDAIEAEHRAYLESLKDDKTLARGNTISAVDDSTESFYDNDANLKAAAAAVANAVTRVVEQD